MDMKVQVNEKTQYSKLRLMMNRLNDANMKLIDQMIRDGRGNEKPSEYLKKTDILSIALQDNYEKRCVISNELLRRGL